MSSSSGGRIVIGDNKRARTLQSRASDVIHKEKEERKKKVEEMMRLHELEKASGHPATKTRRRRGTVSAMGIYSNEQVAWLSRLASSMLAHTPLATPFLPLALARDELHAQLRSGVLVCLLVQRVHKCAVPAHLLVAEPTCAQEERANLELALASAASIGCVVPAIPSTRNPFASELLELISSIIHAHFAREVAFAPSQLHDTDSASGPGTHGVRGLAAHVLLRWVNERLGATLPPPGPIADSVRVANLGADLCDCVALVHLLRGIYSPEAFPLSMLEEESLDARAAMLVVRLKECGFRGFVSAQSIAGGVERQLFSFLAELYLTHQDAPISSPIDGEAHLRAQEEQRAREHAAQVEAAREEERAKLHALQAELEQMREERDLAVESKRTLTEKVELRLKQETEKLMGSMKGLIEKQREERAQLMEHQLHQDEDIRALQAALAESEQRCALLEEERDRLASSREVATASATAATDGMRRRFSSQRSPRRLTVAMGGAPAETQGDAPAAATQGSNGDARSASIMHISDITKTTKDMALGTSSGGKEEDSTEAQPPSSSPSSPPPPAPRPSGATAGGGGNDDDEGGSPSSMVITHELQEELLRNVGQDELNFPSRAHHDVCELALRRCIVLRERANLQSGLAAQLQGTLRFMESKYESDMALAKVLYGSLASDSLAGKATRTGYLTKQGGSIKTWKHRFFILKDNFLLYYRKEREPEPKGVIRLFKHAVVAADEAVAKRKFAFVIQCAALRNFIMCAESFADMEVWMRDIQEVRPWYKNHTYIHREDIAAAAARMRPAHHEESSHSAISSTASSSTHSAIHNNLHHPGGHAQSAIVSASTKSISKGRTSGSMLKKTGPRHRWGTSSGR